ncbi:MAG: thioredoxin family protein [Actinomycetota bacterium]|nr:thioredoxin family protein [Actinomycetota bacterium]
MNRAVVLGIAALVGLLGLAGLRAWQRRSRGPERVDLRSFALELLPTPFAFVVFTSESCAPCKSALTVVRRVADTTAAAEVVPIDSTKQAALTASLGIRSLPTVFLITASGRVVRRWTTVPPSDEIEELLHVA